MGFSHFHGGFSNPSLFKGEVRRGMGYIWRCSIKFMDKQEARPGQDGRQLFIRVTFWGTIFVYFQIDLNRALTQRQINDE